MEIPLKAEVSCTDGVYGRSAYVLMNPILDQITHLVVKADASPHTEFIVPIDVISATTDDTIELQCSKAALERMNPFIQTRFIEEPVTEQLLPGSYGLGSYYYWPYVSSDKMMRVPVEDRQIPLGEVAVQRGTRVEATDGYVGKIDEFLVSPEGGHISHLIMREGHLWGQKDVTIPISAIGKTDEEIMHLNLTKHQIESLPTVAVHRRWF